MLNINIINPKKVLRNKRSMNYKNNNKTPLYKKEELLLHLFAYSAMDMDHMDSYLVNGSQSFTRRTFLYCLFNMILLFAP